MNKKYYLAHSFDSRKKIREWELKLENDAGIELINPFYDVPRGDIEDIDEGIANPRKTSDNLVDNELNLIKELQGIVAIIDGSSSIGTHQEMVYGYIWKKPVYCIITNGKQNHPWIKYHSTKIFTNFEEFENWVKTS